MMRRKNCIGSMSEKMISAEDDSESAGGMIAIISAAIGGIIHVCRKLKSLDSK